MSEQTLLTPREVAERLGLAEHTLAVWRTQRRNLAYVKIGRLVRYVETEVDEYITRSVRDARPHEFMVT